MNTESVDCRRVTVPLPEQGESKPGDFAFDFDAKELNGDREASTHFIYICLPGENRMSAIEIRRGTPGGERVWGWDGNEDKPTLTPSILTPGRWHGYMRSGRLESC